MNLKKAENKQETSFDDGTIEIKDLKELNFNSVLSFSYYIEDDEITVFDGSNAYYKKGLTNDILKKVFESDLLKIGYKEKETYLLLKNKNIEPVYKMFDIEIASYILNPAKSTYKLDDIIMEELGIVLEKSEKNVQTTLEGFGEETKDNKRQHRSCGAIFLRKKCNFV